jgi:hypothetical protein
MHIDIPRLSELVTLIIGGPSMDERLEADRRVARYFSAYGLRRDAACLLDQLAQAKTCDPISPAEAKRVLGRRGQVVNLRPRTPDLCMAEIREKVGGDAIETVEGYGWRLTPLGRLRARRAQGEGLQL